MMEKRQREFVIPGQLLATGNYRAGDGAYREGNEIYSAVVGLAEVGERWVRVIPLEGPYIPRMGDRVLGVVVDLHQYGWGVDINSPYQGNLFASDFLGRRFDPSQEDISKYLTVGDIVAAEIADVDERFHVLLKTGGIGLGKMKGGKLLEISPAKIPRVLGKKGSMLEVLQKIGGCRLFVGQNGRIMVWGKNEKMVDAVVEALFTIEREAHISGLTDRIRLMLEKKKSEVS
ncbi:MAG: exosome complex RNA-binding protein Rrp4 [Candidatus Hadarchaeales archaeon]